MARTVVNVTSSATLDGRDISADGTKLDGIEANATADQTAAEIKSLVEASSDIALAGNPTATTQSSGNNSTRLATTAFVTTAVAGATIDGISSSADATAITIDSSERTSFSSASNRPVSVISTSTNSFVTFQDTNSASIGHVKIGSETDDMVFYANANERMRIASTGKITQSSSSNIAAAFSSTSTTAKLTLSDTNDTAFIDVNATRLGIGHSSSASTQALQIEPTSAEAMRIDSSGDISIGSSSNHAGARVVINDTPPTAFGSPMFQIGQETFTSSGYYSIGLGYTAASYTEPPVEIAAVATSSSGGTTADIVFGTRSVTTNTAVTERMRINSSGNVKISTSAGNYTDALLTARNAGNSIDWGHTNTAGYGSTLGAHAGSGAPFVGLSCGAGTNSNTFRTYGLKGALITTDNAGSLLFSRVTTANADNQSATESMRINSSGNLLLGNTSSNGSFISSNHTQMNIQGNASGAIGSLMIRSKGTTNATTFELAASDGVAASYLWNGSASAMVFATNNAERMRINALGGVYLGTTGSTIGSGNLVVNEGVYVGAANGDNQIRSSSAGSGSATLYIGNAAIQVSSDRRLKENIVNTSMSALDKLDQVRVVDFTWNDPNDIAVNNRNARGVWTGIIAQELVDVFPFAVNAPRNEDDLSIDEESESTWHVDQDQLVPVLIKAIQELKAEVAALKGA